jgi:hypothetical protein
LLSTRLVRYWIESSVCPLLPIRSPIFSPISSTLTHSSSVSNVIFTSTGISIALNISPRNVLILDSISSLDNTGLGSLLLAFSSKSSSLALTACVALTFELSALGAVSSLTAFSVSLTTSFLDSALISLLIVSSIDFFSLASNLLNSSSTELTPALTLALIFVGFELKIPNKPLLPFSITSYSMLSLVVSSLRHALVSASSIVLPVTSIYSIVLPSLSNYKILSVTFLICSVYTNSSCRHS